MTERTASDQTFYPSLVVNLRLLFDPNLQVIDGQLAAVPAPTPQAGSTSTTAASGVSATVRPLVMQLGNTNFSKIVNRVPRTASVELPAYRTAGKFTLEFDWREIPVDPRLVISSAVEIYAGTVSPTDFATGMVSGATDGSRLRRSVLSTQNTDGTPRDDLLILVGVTDNWSITRGEGSRIKLEGRDLRGILLDSPIDPDVMAQIDLTQDIIDVVAQIWRKHPASQLSQIVWNPNDWDNGTPPKVADIDGLTRVRRGASGDQVTNGATPKGDKTSYWDLIVQYCFLVGAVPYFRGRNLVIRPAKSIFDQSKPSMDSPANASGVGVVGRNGLLITGNTADPVFANGVRYDDQGKEFSFRKFILGRNVKELTFERKYTGAKVPVIRCVSWDSSSSQRGVGKLLTTEYPPQSSTGARTTGVSPSGEIAQTDVKIIKIDGYRNQAQLNEIAKNLYEEIGRGEMGGSCKTGFMSSFKGDNADPDILRLRPGHAVEFAMDARPLASQAPASSSELALERMGFDEAALFIQRQLQTDDPNISRAIVASMRGNVIGQLQQFRAANVKLDWSQDAGIQFSFDFQNYFVPRYGVTPQLGANTTPVQRNVVASSPLTQPTGQQTQGAPSSPKVTGPRSKAARTTNLPAQAVTNALNSGTIPVPTADNTNDVTNTLNSGTIPVPGE